MRQGGPRRCRPPVHPRRHPPHRGPRPGGGAARALCRHQGHRGRPADLRAAAPGSERAGAAGAHRPADGDRAGAGPQRRHRRHALCVHRAPVRADGGQATGEPGAAAQRAHRPGAHRKIHRHPLLSGDHGLGVLSHLQRGGGLAPGSAGERASTFWPRRRTAG